MTKGTGARALRSMLERIMLDIMYEVPSREDIAEVTINRAVVEGKKAAAHSQEAGQRRGVRGASRLTYVRARPTCAPFKC